MTNKSTEPAPLFVTAAVVTICSDGGDIMPALLLDCGHDDKMFCFVLPINYAEQIAEGLNVVIKEIRNEK